MVSACFDVASAKPQRALDPLDAVPLATAAIPADPFHNGNMLGDLYRPEGSVRSVTWFQKPGMGWIWGDPDGCERRVVQRFDDDGRCIEVEEWEMGACLFRRDAHLARAGAPAYMLEWRFELNRGQTTSECRRVDDLLDCAGHILATIETPVSDSGIPLSVGTQHVVATYECDRLGRVLRATDFKENGEPQRAREWFYTPDGRVARAHSQWLPTGPKLTEDFGYDLHGRVCVRLASVNGDPAAYRDEDEYDDAGNHCAARELVGDHLERSVEYEYSASARLIARHTIEPRADPHRGREKPQRTDETFEGIDRPLTREVHSLDGSSASIERWTYKPDSQGNWIQRNAAPECGPAAISIWRVIEYAE
jgi:hypothetical protein